MLQRPIPRFPSRPGHPQPLLERSTWQSLNGLWDFALDAGADLRHPHDVRWEHRIEVPFSPETPRSGIGNTGFYRACWYRLRTPLPPLPAGQRLLLRFGAVDYAADVWIDGMLVGHHEGGYTPFAFDITSYLANSDPHEIIVRAEDDPHDLAKPRGKQDWQLNPHSIWYPRTTGIWQSVWLEPVPATWISELRYTPSLSRWEIGFEAWLAGERHDGLRLSVQLSVGDQVLADDTYSVISGEVHRRVALSDPGIDDYRNELLWSPASPTLIEVRARLWAGRGVLLDDVRSYTALRSVSVQGDRFILNGRPQQLRLVLDQGYWPESGMTAPDDAALRRDVELAKAMGFNGVRKHQKLEDPRYLYWADRLGLMVWEEMPSAYRYTKLSIERLTNEWMQAIRRDYSHPCIIAWVPFNESWGVPNLPNSRAERHYVQALYHMTKSLDPLRPVVGNDGWENVATDIIGIHDYDADPVRIAQRYRSQETLPSLLKHERPGGRLLVLEEHAHANHPIMLSEFGGIALSSDQGNTWGYSRSAGAAAFQDSLKHLFGVVRSLGLLAGFCYTQFADTYQEANGLLYADRTPKVPLAQLAAIVSGTPPPSPTPEPVPTPMPAEDPTNNESALLRSRAARGSNEPASFQSLFGGSAEVEAEAAGRVNLIGEHTDYNGGYVLPTLIPLRTRVELKRSSDDRVRVCSANLNNTDILEYRLGEERRRGSWLDYVQGVTRVLHEAGHALGGCSVLIQSSIPVGRGLSSSAALLVAMIRALRQAFMLPIDDLDVALLARRAENDFVGAPVGIMDQMVCSVGQQGSALFLDTQTLQHQHIPLPPELELAVVDSGISHSHASGEYATRRDECERAAKLLGVTSLRQLGLADLPALERLPPPLNHRAHHVITENDRVLASMAALHAHDLKRFGALLYAGHGSLREAYAVSLPEIDLIVELARHERGIYGARMCGGGFGGVVLLAAVPGEARPAAERIAKEYCVRSGRPGALLLPPDAFGL